MKKWANKERGLRMYEQGKDLYNREFHVQDGSWAMFSGVRIYCHDSDNQGTDMCLSLTIAGAKKLIKGLSKFIEERSP